MAPGKFSHRLRLTPARPGVYLMRDAEGGLLYVGKAMSLRNRLRSYFAPPATLAPKVRLMMSRMADFEFIVTDSEDEALLLENTLIKRHKPPFNIRLRDDKNYPYIKIDLREDFPQVYFTRRVQDDGARYFGPYASAGSVRRTMELLKKLFPYRSCTKAITGTDFRPCLDFYIHRCVGPCIGAVDKAQYHHVVEQVIQFLEGNVEDVVKDLERQMAEAAENMEFERAAILRDQVRAITRVAEGQEVKVATVSQEDLDVVALSQAKDEAWVEAFFIRKGKVVGREHFLMDGTEDQPAPAVLAGFVRQFYDSASYVPPRIVVQDRLEDHPLIEKWLAGKRGSRVTLRVGRRGNDLALVKMVAANAQQGLEQMRARWLSNADAVGQAMTELQEELNLPRPPQRVECYDISNIQGTNPVGSMVVSEGGVPRPSQYRRFRIKDVEGSNDYAMMQEMLRRRFKRLGAARASKAGKPVEGKAVETPSEPRPEVEDSFGAVPDLVLIDGGKGHLSAAQEVFLQLGIDDVPLASIAKENEWLFVPHAPDPIVLPRNSQALFLVQRIRDEAHRFAITYHKKLRSKTGMVSALDSVPGVGPKRKRLLLRKFGTVKAIREASLDDLAAVPGMTRSLAEKLKEHL